MRMRRTVAAMTRRRAYGSGQDRHNLFARVDPAAHLLVQECAKRLGVSNSEFVEAALLHIAVDLDPDTGVPTWWDKPLPAEDEELPLTG